MMKSNILASLNIQTKTWLIMLAILPVCLCMNLIVLNNVLLSKFTELEEGQIQRDIGRIEKAVSQKLEHLYAANTDLASWDDSYDFILTKNPDYIESNLTEDALSSLSLSFLYFVNEKGEIVWGQSIDLKTEREIAIEEFSGDRFTAENPLTGKNTPRLGAMGVFHTSAGPALISTAPILDSSGNEPRRGWVVMGVLLNEDAIEELGKLTSLSLAISSDVPFDPPANRLKQLKQLSSSAFYEVRGPAVVHGYAFIKGIGKTPGLVLQVTMSRDIYRKGVVTIRYMAVLISFTMVLVFLVLSILLQRFIVSPITKLTHHILELERTRDLELRLPQKEEECKDEACILAARVNKLLDTIEEMHKKLVDDARIDPLTLVANRRSYEEHLTMEWQRLMRTGGRLSVIMCDIDHFKLYNDRYGHQKGDTCLMMVAGLIRRIPRRPYDLVARYGGEEFVLVLPETSLDDAVSLAERIRKAVLDQHITHEASPTGQWVTLSLGVASSTVVMGTHPEDLVKQADDALYRAKKEGRNQVASV